MPAGHPVSGKKQDMASLLGDNGIFPRAGPTWDTVLHRKAAACGHEGEEPRGVALPHLPHVQRPRCISPSDAARQSPTVAGGSHGTSGAPRPHTPATPRAERPCSPRVRKMSRRGLANNSNSRNPEKRAAVNLLGDGARPESRESRISSAETSLAHAVPTPPRGTSRGSRRCWPQLEDASSLESWSSVERGLGEYGTAGGEVPSCRDVTIGDSGASPKSAAFSSTSSRPPTAAGAGTPLTSVTTAVRPSPGHGTLGPGLAAVLQAQLVRALDDALADCPELSPARRSELGARHRAELRAALTADAGALGHEGVMQCHRREADALDASLAAERARQRALLAARLAERAERRAATATAAATMEEQQCRGDGATVELGAGAAGGRRRSPRAQLSTPDVLDAVAAKLQSLLTERAERGLSASLASHVCEPCLRASQTTRRHGEGDVGEARVEERGGAGRPSLQRGPRAMRAPVLEDGSNANGTHGRGLDSVTTCAAESARQIKEKQALQHATAAGTTELPPGWRLVASRGKRGKMYYYCSKTRTSQWLPPSLGKWAS
jgi:hypothetical protein